MSSSSATASPTERVVDLKNPWLAAGLALLVPGLGHLYQGRHFKAAIYCVCILGLFFTGQALGEWKVVYLSDSSSSGRLSFGPNGALVGRLLDNYLAQFPVGVAAWPAIVQSRRHNNQHDGQPVRIDEAFSAPFEGSIWIERGHGDFLSLVALEGTLTLEPRGTGVAGRFVGRTLEGREITLELRRVVDLGREVSAAELRPVEAVLEDIPDWVERPNDPSIPAGAVPFFKGGIERPFWDTYQVPLGKDGEDRLTAELGSEAEIAWMFTWIAGLLNVLAIWDALDGPAYGYGAGQESKRKRRRKGTESDEETSERTRPEPVTG